MAGDTIPEDGVDPRLVAFGVPGPERPRLRDRSIRAFWLDATPEMLYKLR
jgi:hypothetical protein